MRTPYTQIIPARRTGTSLPQTARKKKTFRYDFYHEPEVLNALWTLHLSGVWTLTTLAHTPRRPRVDSSERFSGGEWYGPLARGICTWRVGCEAPRPAAFPRSPRPSLDACGLIRRGLCGGASLCRARAARVLTTTTFAPAGCRMETPHHGRPSKPAATDFSRRSVAPRSQEQGPAQRCVRARLAAHMPACPPYAERCAGRAWPPGAPACAPVARARTVAEHVRE